MDLRQASTTTATDDIDDDTEEQHSIRMSLQPKHFKKRWATESSAVRSCTPFNPQLDCYPATPTPSCYPSTPTPSCYPNTPNPLQFDASPPTSPESPCLQPITLPSMPPSLPHARRGHDYHHFPAKISPTLRAEPLTRSPETPPISPIDIYNMEQQGAAHDLTVKPIDLRVSRSSSMDQSTVPCLDRSFDEDDDIEMSDVRVAAADPTSAAVASLLLPSSRVPLPQSPPALQQVPQLPPPSTSDPLNLQHQRLQPSHAQQQRLQDIPGHLEVKPAHQHLQQHQQLPLTPSITSPLDPGGQNQFTDAAGGSAHAAGDQAAPLPASSSSMRPPLSIKTKKAGHNKKQKNKDEEEARRLGIDRVISVKDLVHKPLDEVNDILGKSELSEEIKEKARDIRRKGKNKDAAQNCRRRKTDELNEKEREVARKRKSYEALEHRTREEETLRKNLEEEQISLVERLGVAFSLGRIDTQSSEVRIDLDAGELSMRPQLMGRHVPRYETMDQAVDSGIILTAQGAEQYRALAQGFAAWYIPPAAAEGIPPPPPPIRPTPVFGGHQFEGGPAQAAATCFENHRSGDSIASERCSSQQQQLFSRPPYLQLEGGATLAHYVGLPTLAPSTPSRGFNQVSIDDMHSRQLASFEPKTRISARVAAALADQQRQTLPTQQHPQNWLMQATSPVTASAAAAAAAASTAASAASVANKPLTSSTAATVISVSFPGRHRQFRSRISSTIDHQRPLAASSSTAATLLQQFPAVT